MRLLTPGLNVYETNMLMKIVDIDKNNEISKNEFIKVLGMKNKFMKIDPLQEF